MNIELLDKSIIVVRYNNILFHKVIFLKINVL